MGDNSFKLNDLGRIDIRIFFFMMTVVKYCKRSPRMVADIPPVKTFKASLDGALSHTI